MLLFLQILGGVILSLVLLVVAAVVFIKYKFRKELAMVDEFGDQSTPLVVHLNEDFTPEWIEGEDAKSVTQALTSRGFQAGDCYLIPEMMNIKLQSFIHENGVAAMYHNDLLGVWVDLCFEGINGEDITVTNAASGGEIQTLPEMIKIHLTGESTENVIDRFFAETQHLEAKKITQESFRDFFETAYQKSISFQVNKGGVSYEEFLKVHANSDVELTEDKLKQAYLDVKTGELSEWHNGIMQAQDLWELSEHHDVFVVPYQTDSRAFVHYLSDYGLVDDEHIDQLADRFDGQSAPEIFKTLNEGRSKDLRAVHHRSVEQPLKCEIYTVKSTY